MNDVRKSVSIRLYEDDYNTLVTIAAELRMTVNKLASLIVCEEIDNRNGIYTQRVRRHEDEH